MTLEEDRDDLARHAAEMETGDSYCYAVLDEAESRQVGCVYIDPPEKPGAEVEICWWVIDAAVGTAVEVALDQHLSTWIERDWPFQNPRFIGRDLSWREWLDLPDA